MLDIEVLKRILAGPIVMNPVTAICFVLAGASLWLLRAEEVGPRSHRIARGPAQYLVLVAISASLLAVVSYAHGIEYLYGALNYTQMALHTAPTFIVLSVGLLCARPDRGLMATCCARRTRRCTRRRTGGGPTTRSSIRA